MKELHYKGISGTECSAEYHTDHEVDGYGKRVDHIHLVEPLCTEILCDNDARSGGDDIEKNVHHEHDRIGIADGTYCSLIIVAEHDRVDIVEHRVQ